MERTNLPLSPCENRMSGKILVLEIMSRERPRLTRFLRFLTVLNDPYLEKYTTDQNDILGSERHTRGLLTLRKSATELQWFMIYGRLGFCSFWMIQNWFWSISRVWSTRLTWYCIMMVLVQRHTHTTWIHTLTTHTHTYTHTHTHTHTHIHIHTLLDTKPYTGVLALVIMP